MDAVGHSQIIGIGLPLLGGERPQGRAGNADSSALDSNDLTMAGCGNAQEPARPPFALRPHNYWLTESECP